jgi:hypothetical protein
MKTSRSRCQRIAERSAWKSVVRLRPSPRSSQNDDFFLLREAEKPADDRAGKPSGLLKAVLDTFPLCSVFPYQMKRKLIRNAKERFAQTNSPMP